MKKLIYDPVTSGKIADIVCFISGSGTNYREIVKKNPQHRYFVFTNRPGCDGTEIARGFKHTVIELSHIPYLREVRKKYGAGNVPRNALERIKFEQDACALIEKAMGGQPDLVCPAGYDQWTSDWLVDRYYPHILNVHPGDTTKGYVGLHWIASAKAIIARDKEVRSTLFIVDKSEDNGPVLVQSRALDIENTVKQHRLTADFDELKVFLQQNNIHDYSSFLQKADESQVDAMANICNALQNRLKGKGDWEIYPWAVELITAGRVALDGRTVYIDNKPLPVFGYRLENDGGLAHEN